MELDPRLACLLKTEEVDTTDEAAIRDAAKRIDITAPGEASSELAGETLTEGN